LPRRPPTIEAVERTGVSRKALRLYEARGILPPPRRTASGYRVYAPDVLDVLHFVQRGRRLGLTLAEIGHIMLLGQIQRRTWPI
jgi:DNA-binding transcriptional MerR regulator